MDIKITSVEITKASEPFAGGGRSQAVATVEVSLSSEAGTFVLRYVGEKFSSLDELATRIQDRLKWFAQQMTERLGAPIL